ncbi:putative carbohydrate binding domain containing protein [Synechococcus phage S-B05]|nr:putative carbohydrate binding domain containing protein [Synechococcus phage S-B05]
MSAINVNSITGRTGSHGPVLTGVTTISGDLHVGSGLSVTGISTLSNTVVGGATTELVVGGDARITGILTIGTGSVTIDGTSGSSSITGVSTAGIGSVYGVDSINDIAYPTAGGLQFRNRIINGDGRIDQREGGSSVTVVNDGTIGPDRWMIRTSTPSAVSIQRNAGGIAPPDGFDFYTGVTSLAATSLVTTSYFALIQRIEGYNIGDLKFGSSYAKPVTISFYVRSSLTGTFGGALTNGAHNRGYPFTYTISTADTWEYKTITIPGDTSGTWDYANTCGMQLHFGLGSGSNYTGTAGSWQSATILGATGETSVVSTSGATFYLTGVQLEVGERATPFEYHNIEDELQRCKRYFEVIDVAGTSYLAQYTNAGYFWGANIPYMVEKRIAPTSIQYENISGSDYWVEVGQISYSNNSTANISFDATGVHSTRMFQLRPAGGSTPTRNYIYIWEPRFKVKVNSEL